ncbi:MAG: WG repeat-containing protein, partial [Bacteroidota bacterium]
MKYFLYACFIILPTIYAYSQDTDYKWEPVEGLSLVNKGGYYGYDNGIYGGLFGYKDTNGNLVIPYKFNYAYSFKNGRALTAINSKFGFIDKNGKVIIPHKYGMLREFVNGKAGANIGLTFSDAGGHQVLLTNGHWGIIDTTGKIVIPIKYDYEIIFDDNGIAKVSIKNNCGFINEKGKEIIPLKYD